MAARALAARRTPDGDHRASGPGPDRARAVTGARDTARMSAARGCGAPPVPSGCWRLPGRAGARPRLRMQRPTRLWTARVRAPQGVVVPVTMAVGAAAALAPVLNWALVDAARLGLAGAALANGAVQAAAAAALLGYLVARERAMARQPDSAWPGWRGARGPPACWPGRGGCLRSLCARARPARPLAAGAPATGLGPWHACLLSAALGSACRPRPAAWTAARSGPARWRPHAKHARRAAQDVAVRGRLAGLPGLGAAVRGSKRAGVGGLRGPHSARRLAARARGRRRRHVRPRPRGPARRGRARGRGVGQSQRVLGAGRDWGWLELLRRGFAWWALVLAAGLAARRAPAAGRAACAPAAPRAAHAAAARRGLGYNTTAAIYTVSLGVAGAASARVGNALGRGDARAARRAAFAAVGLELALIAGVTGALFAGRDLWAALFTREPEVRREPGCMHAPWAARAHALG